MSKPKKLREGDLVCRKSELRQWEGGAYSIGNTGTVIDSDPKSDAVVVEWHKMDYVWRDQLERLPQQS